MNHGPNDLDERPRLVNSVLRLLGPAGQRLVRYLAHTVGVGIEALSAEQFRRMLAFLVWLAQQEDEDIPDPEEHGGFVELLWRIQQWKTMFIGPTKLPPNFSIGCHVVELEGWMTTDDPGFFKSSFKRRRGVMRAKPTGNLSHNDFILRELCDSDARVKNTVVWGSLFQGLAEDFLSPVKSERMKAQQLVRAKDARYSWTQSLVYSYFALSNRGACMRLVRSAAGADFLISLMRGGSYLGDQLEMLSTFCGDGDFPPHVKVPKPSGKLLDAYLEIDKKAMEAYEKFVETWLDQFHLFQQEPTPPPLTTQRFEELKQEARDKEHLTQAKKLVHTCMLIHAIEEHLLKELRVDGKKVVNVAIAETLVGGGSTNLLLMGIGYLVNTYPDNIRVRILLHRHTLHQLEPMCLDEEIDIEFGLFKSDMDPIVLDMSDTTHKINLTHFCKEAAEAWGNDIYLPLKRKLPLVNIRSRSRGPRWKPPHLSISIATGGYILGEDIDFFMTDGAQHPIILFNGALSGDRFLSIHPGSISSKMLLQLIVAGYFDRYLPGLEIVNKIPRTELKHSVRTLRAPSPVLRIQSPSPSPGGSGPSTGSGSARIYRCLQCRKFASLSPGRCWKCRAVLQEGT
ncbi:hypothetical protein [Sorangium sp. So ce854]|uniref:hypothetical protein n=1 Tax=Sorangium sp. So ce854 TaxID=3133322 RepID=UPI003F5F749D